MQRNMFSIEFIFYQKFRLAVSNIIFDLNTLIVYYNTEQKFYINYDFTEHIFSTNMHVTKTNLQLPLSANINS